MTLRRMFPLLAAGALLLAAAGAAAAAPRLPRPDLLLSGGGTFAVTGTPDGGGLSFAVAPLWPAGDRLRVGAVLFADDMGTALVELTDPNFGSPLGTSADLHRWAWGAGWRADADLLRAGPWTTSASGTWGWWRVEDDRRGANLVAGSAVGFVLGAGVRRELSRDRELGVVVRYHRLSEDRTDAWHRVDRYASAALELRWVGGGRDD